MYEFTNAVIAHYVALDAITHTAGIIFGGLMFILLCLVPYFLTLDK